MQAKYLQTPPPSLCLQLSQLLVGGDKPLRSHRPIPG